MSCVAKACRAVTAENRHEKEDPVLFNSWDALKGLASQCLKQNGIHEKLNNQNQRMSKSGSRLTLDRKCPRSKSLTSRGPRSHLTNRNHSLASQKRSLSRHKSASCSSDGQLSRSVSTASLSTKATLQDILEIQSDAAEDFFTPKVLTPRDKIAEQGAAEEPRTVDHLRKKFMHKLAHEGVWSPVSTRPPAQETVIIFDWDDTLLCSSFIKHALQRGPLPLDVKPILDEIEENVIKLLESALDLGHTFIVTNATEGWVEHSASLYLPGILPVLERVQIISARSEHEPEFPGEMRKWKTQAFLRLQQMLDSNAVANLVSVGDSPLEMEAVVVMSKECETAVIKTVKLREMPSPEELAKEQELLCRQFEQIVLKGEDVKMSMKPRPKVLPAPEDN